jgi:hypothetical protein
VKNMDNVDGPAMDKNKWIKLEFFFYLEKLASVSKYS